MRARRDFLYGIFSVAVFLAFAFSRVEAKTIYVAVSNPDMSFLSGGVAKYKGFFKDEGLDAELVQIVRTANLVSCLAHLLHCRQQQSDQDRYDGDDDEKLDEGEPIFDF